MMKLHRSFYLPTDYPRVMLPALLAMLQAPIAPVLIAVPGLGLDSRPERPIAIPKLSASR